jgi:hypothetical protein
MMSKTFEERKQATWRKWERRLNLPLSAKFRQAFEADLVFNDTEVRLKDLDDALTDFFKRVAALQYFPSPKQASHRPGKRYQRAFQKRLHLIDFVIEEQLTLRNLWQRSFAGHKRINWGKTCNAWNEVHPYDPMTSKVLKATYYRAIAQEDIQQVYFKEKYREYAARLGKLLYAFVSDNEEALERFKLAMERFGQFILEHKEDIENVLSLAERLNAMTGEEKEEYAKLLQSELKEQRYEAGK